jgi:CHASE3 domain sensor protein
MMHKLTLIVVLPLIFEFVFVAVLFALLKFSDNDLARIEKAKDTQSTCAQVLFNVYKLEVATVICCLSQDDSLMDEYKLAASSLPILTEQLKRESKHTATTPSVDSEKQDVHGSPVQISNLTHKLRAQCDTNQDALRSAEIVTVLTGRLIRLMDVMTATPSIMSYASHSKALGLLSAKLISELHEIASLQAAITSHLSSRTNWHTWIIMALSWGLLVSVVISILVMRYVPKGRI